MRLSKLAPISILILGGAVLAACGRHAATTATTPATAAPEDGSAQGGSYQSEAERTKAMEAKARELNQKAGEIQNMQGTEQEKIDAVNKLEQERQDLNKTGDGSAPGNPPPQ
jgi:basic membrane lipoprotein Med (substrate-binding protein (PBP1-ABC) superfamily)